MQEKIDYIQSKNNFFLPQILSLEEQRQRLRCPNHNTAISVCISKECSLSGLMCLENKCQCRRIHLKCHHILLDRVLESIEKHQKEIPQKVKETYKTVYEMINQMIQKLSKLRTKFQREQYFGLRQQQLNFMGLVQESKISQINGKIISSMEKTFDIDIQLNKNSKQDIIKDFESKNKQFDQLCSYIEKSYLQNQEKYDKFNIDVKLFDDSKIILKNQEKQMLNKWLKQSFNGHKIQSKLLFRASQHNFQAIKFHQFCKDQHDTIVIMKNQFDKIIGGFTPNPWPDQRQGKSQFDKTDRSFMFSLNLNKENRSSYSQMCDGPVFGLFTSQFGSDLAIYDKCDKIRKSRGNIGHTYNIIQENKNKYKFNCQQTFQLFTGNTNGNSFLIKQYQVYKIILKVQQEFLKK